MRNNEPQSSISVVQQTLGLALVLLAVLQVVSSAFGSFDGLSGDTGSQLLVAAMALVGVGLLIASLVTAYLSRWSYQAPKRSLVILNVIMATPILGITAFLGFFGVVFASAMAGSTYSVMQLLLALSPAIALLAIITAAQAKHIKMLKQRK